MLENVIKKASFLNHQIENYAESEYLKLNTQVCLDVNTSHRKKDLRHSSYLIDQHQFYFTFLCYFFMKYTLF